MRLSEKRTHQSAHKNPFMYRSPNQMRYHSRYNNEQKYLHHSPCACTHAQKDPCLHAEIIYRRRKHCARAAPANQHLIDVHVVLTPRQQEICHSPSSATLLTALSLERLNSSPSVNSSSCTPTCASDSTCTSSCAETPPHRPRLLQEAAERWHITQSALLCFG